MSVFKRILILANSIKLGGRCLAGREIFLNGESTYCIGPWLRPVGHADGREIEENGRFYWPNDPVKVGDFAEVALAEKMNEPWHPENWRLASSTWRRIADTFEFPPLDLLEEHPKGLWLEPGQRTDRMAHEEALANPPAQSLAMIRPENFRMEFSSMRVEDELKRRRRCLFRYRGVDYDMGMNGGRDVSEPIKLFTIGFTKKNARTFFTKLKDAGVARVLDVRLNNSSQLAGFAKKDDLKYFLDAIAGIGYEHLADLAPTEDILTAFKKKKGDWAVYEREFVELMRARKIEENPRRELFQGGCLLCSEDKPHHCHRRLVAEYLAEKWGGVEVVHL